jgi:hypothetical protein
MRKAVVHGSILASVTCEAFSTRRLEVLSDEEIAGRMREYRSMTDWAAE